MMEEHETKGVVLQNEISEFRERYLLLLPVQYCDNLLVSEKPKKHILSKKVIERNLWSRYHKELLGTANCFARCGNT